MLIYNHGSDATITCYNESWSVINDYAFKSCENSQYGNFNFFGNRKFDFVLLLPNTRMVEVAWSSGACNSVQLP